MKHVTRKTLRHLLENAALGAVVVAAGCESAPPPSVATTDAPTSTPPAPLTPKTPPPVLTPPVTPPVTPPPPPPPPVVETLPFGCVDGLWDRSAAYPEGVTYLGSARTLDEDCYRKKLTGPLCKSKLLKPINIAMYPKFHDVVVRGGTIKRVEHPESLIGPIDTPAKAVLRLSLARYFVGCDVGTVQQGHNGYLVTLKHITGDCPITEALLTMEVSSDGTLREVSRVDIPNTGAAVCAGRRPAGYEAPLTLSGASTGAWLASCAGLEAASVFAFHDLADELRALHAPHRLIEQARAFAEDEVRHAVLTDRLAARHGGRREAVSARPPVLRSLLAIATDNIVEGCVRETFGALIAMVQAARAADVDVARGMAEIADEELSHAAFSWELAAWACDRLEPAEVRALVALAEAELARFDPAADAPREDAREALGWPAPAELERLRSAHAETVRTLWG